MINVEPFKAKLVRNPEQRETKRGPVCNLRVRQVDPGKPSVFIDLAVFVEGLVTQCMERLTKDAVIEVSAAGLIYNEWEAPANGGKRSKHSLIATEIAFAE